MRVALLATADFAIPALKALISSSHQVVGVITGPDQPSGRGQKVQATPVKSAAKSLHLPILTPERFKDPTFLAEYASWRPDLAVVAAFRILPPQVFDLPPLGTLNIHPSLLPELRGPAPIPWALIQGKTETGVSIIRITNRVDAGGVLLQRRVTIDPDETAGQLASRLAEIGAELLLETIERLNWGTLLPIPQDENAVTKAPKLAKDDGRIDWSQDALTVHNRVRGVTPNPGAFTFLDNSLIKLSHSRLSDGGGNPGEILSITDSRLVVACSKGAVEFSEIQRSGKRRLTIEEFFRGYHLTGQSRFTSHLL